MTIRLQGSLLNFIKILDNLGLDDQFRANLIDLLDLFLKNTQKLGFIRMFRSIYIYNELLKSKTKQKYFLSMGIYLHL